ncbi:MAG TPA: hypothetical protein GX715_17385 [Armatimonadetes bacterium]|nr:hypothetical protein [Armatimonadota bacterium]
MSERTGNSTARDDREQLLVVVATVRPVCHPCAHLWGLADLTAGGLRANGFTARGHISEVPPGAVGV